MSVRDIKVGAKAILYINGYSSLNTPSTSIKFNDPHCIRYKAMPSMIKIYTKNEYIRGLSAQIYKISLKSTENKLIFRSYGADILEIRNPTKAFRALLQQLKFKYEVVPRFDQYKYLSKTKLPKEIIQHISKMMPKYDAADF